MPTTTAPGPTDRSGPEGTAVPDPTPSLVFTDRRDAGRRLARHVEARLAAAGLEGSLVLGLARGGVPVAYEVAGALGLPLDVLVVRKLGVPSAPGIAMGALAEGDATSVDDHVVRAARVTPAQFGRVVAREQVELARCLARYRAVRPREPVADRQVVVVDDGLATGVTAVAACRSLAARGAGRIVLAVPVAPLEAVHQFHGIADAVVALRTPHGFGSLDQWYGEFGDVRDDEVLRLLAEAAAWPGANAVAGTRPLHRRHKEPVAELTGVRAGDVVLHGDLVSPADARGLVVLPHASAGGRERPESRHLAAHLEAAGVATLQLDLLTVAERPWRRNVRDVGLLTRRLRAATESVRDDYPWVAYVGTGATAVAVVRAAAEDEAGVAVVVVGDAPPSDVDGTPVAMPEVAMPEGAVLVVPAPEAAASHDELDAVTFRIRDWLVRRGEAAGRGSS